MKILLTGASGYVGKRLLPSLIERGHFVVCCVRDSQRFHVPKEYNENIEVIEVDFLNKTSLRKIPLDIDGAYYLLHSMSTSADFERLEIQCAQNFRETVEKTSAQHVIYLSGIINEEFLSKHLASRKAVEVELAKGSYHCTTLRAGIIIGSGSASFEIIRNLVEKLPVMIAPKWLNTKCQPIGIGDVIQFLQKSLFHPSVYNQSFDIGGPDILTYKEMLIGFAKVRDLKRRILIVPVMTPKLSSYWLYFVTTTSFKLASALVASMKIEVICQDDRLNNILDIQPIGYETALKKTLYKIQGNRVLSSWKDAWVSGRINQKIGLFLDVPEFGCFKDKRSEPVLDVQKTKEKILSIGGRNGWYYANWLWLLRGLVDKAFGGVGLRKGRTNPHEISTGDAIDFWRVLIANKAEGRLLLVAEMKLPGEAWLEWNIQGNELIQTATFRPKGLLGRLYWYFIWPFHNLLFQGLIRKLAN